MYHVFLDSSVRVYKVAPLLFRVFSVSAIELTARVVNETK